MRVLQKTTNDDFRVKAYAGTNGVLLAFDVSEQRRKGLLGFAVEQKEAGKDWQFLLNSLTFPGKKHTIEKFGATPSNLAPVQKFRWQDYSIEPNTTCSYRVRPVYGAPDNLKLDDPLELTVKTDDGAPKDHRVIFNRAVAASQAFGRQFREFDAQLSKSKTLPIEKWPDKPRKWLEHGLLDQILDFIGRAKNAAWALDIAIYEYELEAIVEAVNAAKARNVDLRVLYHAKKNDEQTHENEANLKKVPAAMKRGRVTSKIFHDKFIVLSMIDRAGKRRPKAVLCGSTNFTENGIYRQANVVHTTENAEVAANYLTLFEQVWENHDDVGKTRDWITANNRMNPANRMFAGFSPRSDGSDLKAFIDVIGAAKKDVLFATAFQLPEEILDALLGKDHDDVLRFGIQNKGSRITGYHGDRTADFAATAMLSTGIEGWVKEGLRQQKGSLLVHLKAVVTDFTTDNPAIISGSHNLSKPASNGNDENYLIIRGDTDLADRYGLELMRFYEHYRFRYYAKKLKLKQVNPLTEDDSWTGAYFREGHIKALSRLRFAGR
jgi:phosphatidylserine/phosphatidylglycerophosphate/cardiolipin synthase-like enzyme